MEFEDGNVLINIIIILIFFLLGLTGYDGRTFCASDTGSKPVVDIVKTEKNSKN